MPTSVFYSFHSPYDRGRLDQVESLGVVVGQRIPGAEEWSAIEAGGDASIQRWMVDTMDDREVLLLLVGAHTHTRTWVLWELARAWRVGQPIVAVRVHGLSVDGETDDPGPNPLELVDIGEGRTLADVVCLRDPSGATTGEILDSIRTSLPDWIADAVVDPSPSQRRP